MSISQLLISGGLLLLVVAVGAAVALRLRDHLADGRVRSAAAHSPVLRDLLRQLEKSPSLRVRRTLARRKILDDVQRLDRWAARTGGLPERGEWVEPFPDSRLVDRHLLQVRSGSDEIARAVSAALLGWTGSPAIVAPLLAAAEIANVRSPLLHRACLDSLARVHHPDAVRHLFASLDRAGESTAAAVVDILRGLGLVALDPAIACLDDPASSDRLRMRAVDVLAGIDHASSTAALLRALVDRDAELRARTAACLGERTSGPELLDRLEELLFSDPVPMVRAAATGTWLQLDADGLHRLLARTFTDPHAEKRARAVELLELCGEEGEELLVVALTDPDPGVGRAAARALDRIGAVTDALDRLALPGYDAGAAELLIDVGRAGHLDPLFDALNRPGPHLVVNVVRVLARVGDPKAGAPLGQLLERTHEGPARARIVDALRRVEARGEIERVCGLLGARDEWVRKAAVDYLVEFGNVDTIALVFPLLADPNPWTRTSALKVIEALRVPDVEVDHRAVQPLLQDPYDFVRAQALRTLCARHEFELLLESDVIDHIAEERIRSAFLRALGDHATIVAMPLITRLAAFSADSDFDLLRHAAARALAALDDAEIDMLLLGYADPEQETSTRWFASVAWSRATREAAGTLRHELLSDADPRVRAGMVHALAEREIPRAEQIVALHAALGDPAPIVVRAGLSTVGRLGLHELESAVSDALHHPDEEVRIDATFALALLPGPSERIESLQGVGTSRAQKLASTAGRLLLADPSAVVSWIGHLRQGSDRRIIERWITGERALFTHYRRLARKRDHTLAGRVLLCRSAFEVEQHLGQILASDLRDSERLLAVHSLIHAGSERSTRHVRGAFFRDGSPRVRAEALAHIVEREPAGERRNLLDYALTDPDEAVRIRAIRLCATLAAPEAASILSARLGSGDAGHRAAVIERLAVLLQEHGEEIVDFILNPSLEPAALVDLCRVVDRCSLPVCTDILESLFDHPAAIVRATAMRPLLRRLGRGGWDLVDRGLGDPSPKVRAQTVQALCSRESEAIGADVDRLRQTLRRAHEDNDPEVRSRCALAVARLGLEGTAGILGVLERDEDPRVEHIARQARQQYERSRQESPLA